LGVTLSAARSHRCSSSRKCVFWVGMEAISAERRASRHAGSTHRQGWCFGSKPRCSAGLCSSRTGPIRLVAARNEGRATQRKFNDATMNPHARSNDERAIADTYWSQPGSTTLVPGWPLGCA
jgi:hypothetical protein